MKKSSPLRCALLWHLPLRAAEKPKLRGAARSATFLKKKAGRKMRTVTKAYIAATDAMLNYIVDEKMGSKRKLKYISFDFASNFALNNEQREKMVSAFSVYGIPADTEGAAAHSTLTQRNEGVVFQYIIGGQSTIPRRMILQLPWALYGNKGYAYYYDFNIFGDDYVLVNFEQAYEKMR